MSVARLGAAAAAAIALVVTLPTGARTFAAAVALLGAVVLLEVAARLAGVGQRPLVPAAAVGAVGAPLAVAAAGASGWERLPLLMALMLLAAFGVALVAPRKRQITRTLGATVLPGLLVGMGAAGLVVLRSATAGFRWTVGLLLMTALPVLLGALAARVEDRGADVPVRMVAAGAVGGALLLGLRPPFDVVTSALLLCAGVGGAWAATALTAAVRDDREGAQWASDAVLRTLTAPLIAGPVVAFVAFATQV